MSENDYTDRVVIADHDAYLGADDFSLDELVELLRVEHGLLQAYVEQTGGGVATVYAGARFEVDGEPRWTASAGPGTYGWGETSVANLAEFFVGPDDDGEGGSTEAVLAGVTTLRQLAALVAAQARTTYGELVDAETLDGLGLDSSLRSMTPEVGALNVRTTAYVEAANAALHAAYARGATVTEAYAASTAAGQAALASHDGSVAR